MAAKTLSSIVGGGLTRKTEEFTASGTWSRPAGVNEVEFLMCGGGGGGGYIVTVSGNRGGGGGGEIVWGVLPVSADIIVTIGAGGLGFKVANGSAGNGDPGTATIIDDSALLHQTADFGNGGTSGVGAGGGSGGETGVDPLSRFEGGAGGAGITAPLATFLYPDLIAVNDDDAGGGGSSIGIGGNGGRGGGDGTKGGGGGGSNGTSADPAGDAGDGGDGYCLIMWWE